MSETEKEQLLSRSQETPKTKTAQRVLRELKRLISYINTGIKPQNLTPQDYTKQIENALLDIAEVVDVYRNQLELYEQGFFNLAAQYQAYEQYVAQHLDDFKAYCLQAGLGDYRDLFAQAQQVYDLMAQISNLAAERSQEDDYTLELINKHQDVLEQQLAQEGIHPINFVAEKEDILTQLAELSLPHETNYILKYWRKAFEASYVSIEERLVSETKTNQGLTPEVVKHALHLADEFMLKSLDEDYTTDKFLQWIDANAYDLQGFEPAQVSRILAQQADNFARLSKVQGYLEKIIEPELIPEQELYASDEYAAAQASYKQQLTDELLDPENPSAALVAQLENLSLKLEPKEALTPEQQQAIRQERANEVRQFSLHTIRDNPVLRSLVALYGYNLDDPEFKAEVFFKDPASYLNSTSHQPNAQRKKEFLEKEATADDYHAIKALGYIAKANALRQFYETLDTGLPEILAQNGLDASQIRQTVKMLKQEALNIYQHEVQDKVPNDPQQMADFLGVDPNKLPNFEHVEAGLRAFLSQFFGAHRQNTEQELAQPEDLVFAERNISAYLSNGAITPHASSYDLTDQAVENFSRSEKFNNTHSNNKRAKVETSNLSRLNSNAEANSSQSLDANLGTNSKQEDFAAKQVSLDNTTSTYSSAANSATTADVVSPTYVVSSTVSTGNPLLDYLADNLTIENLNAPEFKLALTTVGSRDLVNLYKRVAQRVVSTNTTDDNQAVNNEALTANLFTQVVANIKVADLENQEFVQVLMTLDPSQVIEIFTRVRQKAAVQNNLGSTSDSTHSTNDYNEPALANNVQVSDQSEAAISTTAVYQEPNQEEQVLKEHVLDDNSVVALTSAPEASVKTDVKVSEVKASKTKASPSKRRKNEDEELTLEQLVAVLESEEQAQEQAQDQVQEPTQELDHTPATQNENELAATTTKVKAASKKATKASKVTARSAARAQKKNAIETASSVEAANPTHSTSEDEVANSKSLPAQVTADGTAQPTASAKKVANKKATPSKATKATKVAVEDNKQEHPVTEQVTIEETTAGETTAEDTTAEVTSSKAKAKARAARGKTLKAATAAAQTATAEEVAEVPKAKTKKDKATSEVNKAKKAAETKVAETKVAKADKTTKASKESTTKGKDEVATSIEATKAEKAVKAKKSTAKVDSSDKADSSKKASKVDKTSKASKTKQATVTKSKSTKEEVAKVTVKTNTAKSASVVEKAKVDKTAAKTTTKTSTKT
ncbi:hypothetical protein CKF58_04735, partial [Psittacicella hinzii]